jgi:hypothetical protein
MSCGATRPKKGRCTCAGPFFFGRGTTMGLLQTFDFDIGLSFMGELPIEEVKDILRKRVTHLAHILQYLEVHQAEALADEHVPNRSASAVFEHPRQMNCGLFWNAHG